MRTTLAAGGLLLLVLTWILIRGMNSGAQRFDLVFQALDQFATTERALQRDILSARAGSLRNYDPLVWESSKLRSILNELRDGTAGNEKERNEVNKLAATIIQQEDLTEQFKSKNALLQNSLAYFGLFSTRLSESIQDDSFLAAVNSLFAAMLNLTVHTSADNSRAVEVRLQELAAKRPVTGDADSIDGLLVHGRLLHELLPSTDRLLMALLSLPLKGGESTLRAAVSDSQHTSREKARQYRLFFYFISLLLLGLLVHLGQLLRRRALSLRWRAGLEHVIACLSTNLINCSPEEMRGRIEQGLMSLAEYIGADRAYLVLSGETSNVFWWCRDGVNFPPDWPRRAAQLASQLQTAEERIIYVPAAGGLPAGSSKDALTEAGISSWVCVSSMDENASAGVLGFDAVCSSLTASFPDLRLLRMAFDAIVSAVSRELLERERMRLEVQLQRARRMETVGALASGVAHNFNNIIGAILGYSEIAESNTPATSPVYRSLTEIHRAGIRARDLIDQILVFGRRRDGRRAPLSLPSFLAEIKSLLCASLPPGMELSVEETPEIMVSGEHSQLQQVILNLCHNAAQAMGETGRINITSAVRRTANQLRLSRGELSAGQYAIISVSDTGLGMTKDITARIFEPFFTTRKTGNGLGLATACEIVLEHGGAIDVQSTPGKGSRFEVWLPCFSPGENTAANPLFLRGRGETVLVTDDNPRRLLREEEMLAALGYEPVGFADPSGALAAVRASPQRFDAFLVAHVQPVTSALSLAQSLQEIAPHRPVLLASPSAASIGSGTLLDAGVSEIVRWPLIAGEIAAALANSFNEQAK